MIIKKIMRSIIYIYLVAATCLYYDVVVAEMINSIVLKAAEKHIKIKHVHNIAYRVYISDECSAVQCSALPFLSCSSLFFKAYENYEYS